MSSRATSFGAVAENYERFRLGYPTEIADVVLGHATGTVRTALEIGAGTGKATRLFADRGIAVTATDPDEAMLAVLRARLPPTVRTIRASFEQVRTEQPYDLVYAAAALHWTDPAGRWERMAALLKPGGVFANFGGPVHIADPALERALQAAREPYVSSDRIPSPDGTPPEQQMQWPGTELLRSGLFTDVRQLRIPRRLTVSAAFFAGHLATVSAYLELPEGDRETVQRRMEAVLPARIELEADIDVHVARRTASS